MLSLLFKSYNIWRTCIKCPILGLARYCDSEIIWLIYLFDWVRSSSGEFLAFVDKTGAWYRSKYQIDPALIYTSYCWTVYQVVYQTCWKRGLGLLSYFLSLQWFPWCVYYNWWRKRVSFFYRGSVLLQRQGKDLDDQCYRALQNSGSKLIHVFFRFMWYDEDIINVY